MATLQTGLGVTETYCDATINYESDTFVDDGSGVTVFALYRLGWCDTIPTSDFVWYYKEGASWIEFHRWTWNTSLGYAYEGNAITDGAGYDFKVTFRGLTKYFSITPPCSCTSWVDQECVDDTHRRQTRTCIPSGCDIEERTVYDATCTVDCSQYFRVVDQDGNNIEDARVCIGTYPCGYTDAWGRVGFPLTPGQSYTATASKAGYGCLDCIETFTACIGSFDDPPVLSLTTMPECVFTEYSAPAEALPTTDVTVASTIANLGDSGDFQIRLTDTDTDTVVDRTDWTYMAGKNLHIHFLIFGANGSPDTQPIPQINEMLAYVRERTDIEITHTVNYVHMPLVPTFRECEYHPTDPTSTGYFIHPDEVPADILELYRGDVVIALWNAAEYPEVCYGGLTGMSSEDPWRPLCSIPFNTTHFDTPPGEEAGDFEFGGTAVLAVEFCHSAEYRAKWVLGFELPDLYLTCPDATPPYYVCWGNYISEHLWKVADITERTGTLTGTMPDNDWHLRLDVFENDYPNTALDTETFTIQKSTVLIPKGEIVSYSAPAELAEGEELQVGFVAKNIGIAHDILGGFKMELWIDGTKYDTAPYTSWKSLDHNETWEDEVNTILSIPLWSMPDHDVNCEIVLNDKYLGEQASEAFVVAVGVYEPPYGEILAGYPKIDSDSCTAICDETNLCKADEEERPSFIVKYKNTGEEDGYFQAWLIAFNGYTIAAPNSPDGDGKVLDEEFHVLPTGFKLAAGEEREVTLTPKILAGWMPAEDWSLAIQIAQISSVLGAFEEWHDIKPFAVCHEHISTDGYSITFDDLPTKLKVGESYTFTGELKNNQGRTISGQSIAIWEDDLFFDDDVVSGTTDVNGAFAIPWEVRKVEGVTGGDDAEFYACYRCDQANEVRSGVKRTIISEDEDEKDIKMLALYAGAAVGIYAVGSFLPGKAGKVVPVVAVIPAGLAAYEGYKLIKGVIP